MSAEGQIKAFIDRILRLKEEQDVIGDDIRDIYAEAKGMGFDKTAMGNVVAHLRKVAKKGSETIAEQGAIFDIYLAAYEGHAPAPARVRENIEQFDPLTGEFLDDAPRSDAGLDIVTKHTEIAAASQGEAEVPSAEAETAGANEGGENVDRSATRAGLNGGPVNLEPSGPEAERATSFTAKPPSSLRPHCRQPEACGGYGRNHCHTCAKAMREREPAEELA